MTIFIGADHRGIDLKNAINTIKPATGDTFLVPYRYVPKFVFLSSEEMIDYIEKTKRIAKAKRNIATALRFTSP